MNELFSKTEILRLEVKDMNHLEEISTHPPQHSFCNLKALEVFNCTDLVYLFTVSVAKGLTKLEILKIWCCPVLKSVVKGENSEVEVIEFHKLKILYLIDLPELVSLCDCINVMDLPELVELHLCQLNKFTSIFHENNINTSAKQSLMTKEVVMSKLEKLKVYRMQNLKEIWPCEITSTEAEVNNISMLREIELKDCDTLVNLFPTNPMQLLGHLELLTIDKCGSVDALFNIHLGRKNEKLSSNNSLKSIRVSRLDNLREVFRIKDVKSNYSDGLFIHGFRAIEHIQIWFCKRFRNIVAPTTANFDMRALKDIDISCCGGYDLRENELVMNNREQKTNTISVEEISQVGALLSNVVLPSSFETTLNFHNLSEVRLYNFEGVEVIFEIESRMNHRDQSLTTQQQPPLLLPYLEHVKIERMAKLSHVWKCNNWNEFFIFHKNKPQLSSFQNFKTIYLSNCDNIKYLFSPLMAKLLSNLEKIEIDFCHCMEEVVSNRDSEEMIASTYAHSTTATLFPRLYYLKLSYLHNLKHIGRGGFTMKFPNLKILNIGRCDHLENIFTFSTIESLKELETLTITGCMYLKVIVRKEYGEHTTQDVVFPRLKSIELSDLPNLEGFLLGMNTGFQLPLLDNFKINDCPRMMAFTSGRTTTPRLKYIHTELGKYNPENGLNFDVTSSLHQTPSPSSDGFPTISEWKQPLSFRHLVEMTLERNHELRTVISFKELLQLQELETLYVESCSNVEEVFEVTLEVSNNESQTVVNLPKLREVHLHFLHSLKCIWKSNRWNVLEFPNLTRLSIGFCRSLEHVFTCSMVSCVMQLQELHVQNCENMQVIVKKEEDVDAISSEISFPRLKSLKLEELEMLKGFCIGKEDFTLPSLDTLKIKECEEISVFTKGRLIAPKLRVVETGDGSFNVGEDINTFIMTKKQEGLNF